MNIHLATSLAAAMTAVAALATATAPAQAMTVQPMVIDLKPAGQGMTQVVRVTNTATQALPVELKVQELGFDANGVKAINKPSTDLVIYPPQALIQPGQTQSFRVQYVGASPVSSKHYYVTVAQMPVQAPGAHSAIQVLYDFEVLVSVGPQQVKPALRVVSAQVGRNDAGQPAPIITVSNDSPAYGYISRGQLRIVERDAAGKEVFHKVLQGPEIQQTVGYGLVGSGQTRRMMLPVVLPVEGGTVEAQFTPEARR